ncbi:MerR family transcriptional regulator [Streptomyces olivoreticuli]
MLDLDGDLQTTLWTTAQAAEAAGVDPGVIRVWVHRGHLHRANSPRCRIPKYRAIDVVRAEKATRQRARRAYSSPQAA